MRNTKNSLVKWAKMVMIYEDNAYLLLAKPNSVLYTKKCKMMKQIKDLKKEMYND